MGEEEEVEETQYYDRMTRLQRGIWIWSFFARGIGKCLPLIYRKKRVVSEIKNPLLLISATDLAEMIRKKQVTCVEVIEAYTTRIKEVDPLINAVMDARFEEALEDAKHADELVAKLTEEELQTKYPLLGIPFSVKEQIGVKGLSVTCGLKSRKGIKAAEDGACIKLLRDAGAIPLCVTKLPELCLAYETHHLEHGRTLNPYNTSRTPGGSSGGEAALIGAGASLFGIASDFFGSIRIPSAFTGIFGLRPTTPLVSADKSFPPCTDPAALKAMTFGPMTRYAKDLPLILRILVGENISKLTLDAEFDVRKLKVYYVPEFRKSVEQCPWEEEVEHGIQKAIQELINQGADVEELPKNINLDHMFEKGITRMYTTLPRKLLVGASDIPQKPNPVVGMFGEMAKWLCCFPNHTIMHLFTEFACRWRGIANQENVAYFKKTGDKLEAQLVKLLADENAVLLFPSFPRTAYHHYGTLCYASGTQYALLTSMFNLPSINVPLGLSSQGLPLNLQVISGRLKDHLIIQVAQVLERSFGGWVPPPDPQRCDSIKVVNNF